MWHGSKGVELSDAVAMLTSYIDAKTFTIITVLFCKRKHFNSTIKFVPENTHSIFCFQNRVSRRIIELIYYINQYINR